jgi:hypothetical protein
VRTKVGLALVETSNAGESLIGIEGAIIVGPEVDGLVVTGLVVMVMVGLEEGTMVVGAEVLGLKVTGALEGAEVTPAVGSTVCGTRVEGAAVG